jgi:hypothetical protein
LAYTVAGLSKVELVKIGTRPTTIVIIKAEKTQSMLFDLLLLERGSCLLDMLFSFASIIIICSPLD